MSLFNPHSKIKNKKYFKRINRYYSLFKKIIFNYQITQIKNFIGEVEIDEFYFGPKRIKDKSNKLGRESFFKKPVFLIYERQGRVYTEIIPDCKAKILKKVIAKKIDPSSIVYSD